MTNIFFKIGKYLQDRKILRDSEKKYNSPTLPTTFVEARCRVAFFLCSTAQGRLQGFKIGVVVVTTELGTWARIGTCTQIGGYKDDVDAAFIFHEGAELDVEAAERIIEMHNGRQVYID